MLTLKSPGEKPKGIYSLVLLVQNKRRQVFLICLDAKCGCPSRQNVCVCETNYEDYLNKPKPNHIRNQLGLISSFHLK